MQLAYLLQTYQLPQKKRGSERSEVIGKIYELYTSGTEKELRRKENWKRYVQWLKANRRKHDNHAVSDFKKNKAFLRELDIKKFCYFTSHLKLDDLYYVLSICKDKVNRSESIGVYLYTQVIRVGTCKKY